MISELDIERRKKLNEFLREFSEVCHKHKMFIDGKPSLLWVEDSYGKIIALDLFYDMEAQEYTATLVEEGELKCKKTKYKQKNLT